MFDQSLDKSVRISAENSPTTATHTIPSVRYTPFDWQCQSKLNVIFFSFLHRRSDTDVRVGRINTIQLKSRKIICIRVHFRRSVIIKLQIFFKQMAINNFFVRSSLFFVLAVVHHHNNNNDSSKKKCVEVNRECEREKERVSE